MASSLDSHTKTTWQRGPAPGAALKRSAAHLYQYLKPKTRRSDSEHLLFTKVISIMELISATEKASLLTSRETRGRKKPTTSTSREISEFERMRDLFFNRSPGQLRHDIGEAPSPPSTPSMQVAIADPTPSLERQSSMVYIAVLC